MKNFNPYDDSLPLISGSNSSNCIQIDPQGHLLVEGIENWITQLLPIDPNAIGDPYLRMKDAKTGAVYLIKRVE